jgi:glycerol kinase
MNLRSLGWDGEMLDLLRVPRALLPNIVDSAGVVGRTERGSGIAGGVPIAGMAGDQHAALFGQACFAEGDAKCTYGTGAFILVNTGARPVPSRFGLLTTLAWKIGGQAVYALEGSAFVAGAAVQWLRDGLGIIKNAAEIEALARQVESSDGVAFVPALAGLGAPYWDAGARGIITGITRGTRAAHLARATLEAIAHEVDDLVRAMSEDLGREVTKLRVDGGAAANDLLMQLQADFSALTVERPEELESTAKGAAMLAGVGAGLFENAAAAAKMSKAERLFCGNMDTNMRHKRRKEWLDAVRRARSTVDPEGLTSNQAAPSKS